MESRILTINGGSSTIKFAVYIGNSAPQQILKGQVEGIGQTRPVLTATHNSEQHQASISGKDHQQAAEGLIAWIGDWSGQQPFTAVGHRVVHGGVKLNEHQIVTDELIEELHKTQPLDLAHLPREIALIEAFRNRFDNVPQIACFDTAFHRDLPRIAHCYRFRANIRTRVSGGSDFTVFRTCICWRRCDASTAPLWMDESSWRISAPGRV